jgi:hypothetical protein
MSPALNHWILTKLEEYWDDCGIDDLLKIAMENLYQLSGRL